MDRLCTMNLLGRLVLAWFIATLTVATASPVFKPVDIHVVCSSTGSMLVIGDVDQQGKTAAGPHSTLDCPACLSFLPVLPQEISLAATEPLPETLAVQWGSDAPHLSPAGAPLPPRGPPNLA